MASHHPRKSLEGVFPGLSISSSSSSIQKPHKTKMSNLPVVLSKSFSKGWPTWLSVRGHNRDAGSVDFTIRLAQHLMHESNKRGFSTDPARIIHEVRKESQRGGVPAFNEVWEQLENSLVVLVYGSNFIESAGTNYAITLKLCREVFRGRDVQVEIDENDADFKAHVDVLVKTGRKTDLQDVIQSRKDVVQHAKALNFAIESVVLDNSPWSEELILETHRILCDAMDAEEVTPGKYRTGAVAVRYEKPGDREKGKKVKTKPCISHRAVPKYMKDMVNQMNADICKAEDLNSLDPYTLAARYHHQFVNIHPFWDGNGRMSRILLNTLLLKYAGHVADIGSSQVDKDDYLEIVRRGADQFYKEDMEVDFQEQIGHEEIARHVLTKSKANLERLWTWVRTRSGKSAA